MYIIFDYDGTLHDTMVIYGPALKSVYKELVAKGLMKPKYLSDNDISQWLGYSAKDMWSAFAPSLTIEQRELSSTNVGKYMYALIERKKAKLYNGSLQLIEKLKQDGHTLILLSNCKIKYMELHKKAFELEKYFSYFYCGEEYNWLPKKDIFPIILNDLNLSYDKSTLNQFIVIGDRFHDIEIAKVHKIKSIGCSYGFGKPNELESANILANSPLDILKFI